MGVPVFARWAWSRTPESWGIREISGLAARIPLILLALVDRVCKAMEMIKSTVWWRVVFVNVARRKAFSFLATALHSAPSDETAAFPLRAASLSDGLRSRIQLIAANVSCFGTLVGFGAEKDSFCRVVGCEVAHLS